MTIEQAIQRFDEVQPNDVSVSVKLMWLNQLDTQIYQAIIEQHEGWEQVPEPCYCDEVAFDAELLVGPPWDSMYIHWLQSRLDLELGEIGRFNNSNGVFNHEYGQFANTYRRTHMPLTKELRFF